MDNLHLTDKANSGIPGLDEILGGGFTRGCLFLIEGNPGTGKTTMALRFLLQGAAAGERNLYITLSETKSELLNGAASHGWSLDSNIEVFELQSAENMLDADQQQSLLYSSFIPPNWSWARPSSSFSIPLSALNPIELYSTVCRRFAYSRKAHFGIAVNSWRLSTILAGATPPCWR